MAYKLSTRSWPDSQRQPLWAQAIGSAYFPLSLEFAPSSTFSGSLQIWETGSTPLTLSRLRSSQLGYSRSKAQVSEDHEACYLVTVPRRSEVHFEQDGRALHCQPGGFIFERGDAPTAFTMPATTTSGCSSSPNARCMANCAGPSATPASASMPSAHSDGFSSINWRCVPPASTNVTNPPATCCWSRHFQPC